MELYYINILERNGDILFFDELVALERADF